MTRNEKIKKAIESNYTVEGQIQGSSEWHPIVLVDGEPEYQADWDDKRILLLDTIRVFAPIPIEMFDPTKSSDEEIMNILESRSQLYTAYSVKDKDGKYRRVIEITKI